MEDTGAEQPNGLTTAGTVIAERYRLVDRIAGGGMGDVWRAVDEVLGRTVAVKLLRPEYAEDEQFRERLRREARAASAISDAGVVPVFDFGEIERENASPLSYLVMEYVDGLSLSEEVSALGPLGAERTILILEQTASALQAAHDAGVIHRDIKPGNIMVTTQGDLKITDFGIARASDSVPLTRTGVLTGTAKYLSPEQARGHPATAASDLYSLGVVAYACLTGDVPFHQGNDLSIALAHVQQEPPALPADVPDGLRELVMRMLEKNPDDRPATAGEVSAAARALRHGDAQTLSGEHPFPAAMPASDIQPTETRDPTKTEDIVPGIADAAVLASPTTVAETMAVPAVESTGEQMPVPMYEATSVPGAIDPRPSRGRRIFVGAIVLLLLIAGAVAFFVLQSGGSQVVPDVVGKQRQVAQTMLTKAGLQAKFTVADVPATREGIVVKQSAARDSKVDKGSTVTLTVASGKVDLPMDELLGAKYAEAAATLDNLGLTARQRNAFSSKDKGTVIGVSPENRASVGSVVTLTVSAGSQPKESNNDNNGDKKQDKNKDKGPTAKPTTSPTSATPEPTTPTEGGTP